jgi:hypothetical protein
MLPITFSLPDENSREVYDQSINIRLTKSQKAKFEQLATDVGIPVSTFSRMLIRFMVDIYSREWHRGIEAQPIESWNRAVEIWPPALPENARRTELLLLPYG